MPERISSVVAWLFVLLGILTGAIGGLLAWHYEPGNLVGLAFWIAVLAGLGVAAILLVQRRWKRYRSPTDLEVFTDLVGAMWSVPISVPLLLVALDGKLLSWDDSWVPASLVAVATVFPAIRPRRRRETMGRPANAKNTVKPTVSGDPIGRRRLPHSVSSQECREVQVSDHPAIRKRT